MTISSSEIENVTLSTRFLCHSSTASSRFSSNWKRNFGLDGFAQSDSASLLLVTMRCSNPASRPAANSGQRLTAGTCSIHCGSVAAANCSSVKRPSLAQLAAVGSSLTATGVSVRIVSWMDVLAGLPGAALLAILASPRRPDSANSAMGIGADGRSGLFVGNDLD